MESLFTKSEWDLLPEGFPAELIEGTLVRDPSPTYGHQCVAARLRARLFEIVGPDLCPETPADVLIDEINIFEPDLVVLRDRPPMDSSYVGIPLLVIEVLSPSTAQRDRTVKKDKLLEAGVDEVWLVDRRARSIEIHRAGPDVRTFRDDQIAPSRAVSGFEVVPGVLFAD